VQASVLRVYLGFNAALLKWVARLVTRNVGVTRDISMASRLCSASFPFIIGDPGRIYTVQ